MGTAPALRDVQRANNVGRADAERRAADAHCEGASTSEGRDVNSCHRLILLERHGRRKAAAEAGSIGQQVDRSAAMVGREEVFPSVAASEVVVERAVLTRGDAR